MEPPPTSLCLDMEDLAVEPEKSQSDIYFSLGLKEKVNGNAGNPRVLSLISSFLERSVQKNEMFLETTQSKDIITIFHGSREPTLGIRQYIDRIFKYSCCSPSCFVIAQIYVDRFIQRRNVRLTSLNVHRLLITSVMVAAKFIDDAFYSNAYFAKVGGVSTAELNRLEMKFLFGLDFRLHLSVSTFVNYCSQLEKEVPGGVEVQVERPLRVIRACGIKQSWSNNEDSACAPTVARQSHYTCVSIDDPTLPINIRIEMGNSNVSFV